MSDELTDIERMDRDWPDEMNAARVKVLRGALAQRKDTVIKLRAQVATLTEERDQMAASVAVCSDYLEVMGRSFPDRFDCLLCGATAIEEDHRPNCELLAAKDRLRTAAALATYHATKEE
jgi:hypothetical protein